MLFVFTMTCVIGFSIIAIVEHNNRATVTRALDVAYGFFIFQMDKDDIYTTFATFIRNLHKRISPTSREADRLKSAKHYYNKLAFNQELNPRQQVCVFATILGIDINQNVIHRIQKTRTVRELVYLAEKVFHEKDPVNKYLVLVR